VSRSRPGRNADTFRLEYEELADAERELLRGPPEAVTAMLMGNLQARTPRLRADDRRLVEACARARAKAKRQPLPKLDAQKSKDGLARGTKRAVDRKDALPPPFTFTDPGDDAA
jgi:hypothetical protein